MSSEDGALSAQRGTVNLELATRGAGFKTRGWRLKTSEEEREL